MKKMQKLLFFILLITYLQPGFALQNSFYILRQSADAKPSASPALISLTTHFKKINLLIAQAYHVDQQGILTGQMDTQTLQFGSRHKMKIMALVTNIGFDQTRVHELLSHPVAIDCLLKSLLLAAAANHYTGIQFDFEGVALEDKENLTRFYQLAAIALHKQGYLMSVAIIPCTSDQLNTTDFLKRKYINWTGAYDLKALAKCCDFISLMAYDQHTHGNIPGPTANIQWVEAVVSHSLRFIPAQKLSLGIPVYSGHWATGSVAANSSGKITTQLSEMSYQRMQCLLKTYHVKLTWDPNAKASYGMFEHNWLNEYIFAEDARSFKAKLSLAKKYHLRGISVFNLGNEDPAIWQIIS